MTLDEAIAFALEGQGENWDGDTKSYWKQKDVQIISFEFSRRDAEKQREVLSASSAPLRGNLRNLLVNTENTLDVLSVSRIAVT